MHCFIFVLRKEVIYEDKKKSLTNLTHFLVNIKSLLCIPCIIKKLT